LLRHTREQHWSSEPQPMAGGWQQKPPGEHCEAPLQQSALTLQRTPVGLQSHIMEPALQVLQHMAGGAPQPAPVPPHAVTMSVLHVPTGRLREQSWPRQQSWSPRQGPLKTQMQ